MKKIDFDNADLAMIILGALAGALIAAAAWGKIEWASIEDVLSPLVMGIGTLATPKGAAKWLKKDD